MLLFRWTIFMLLLAAGVSFAFYIGTGQARFRQYGIRDPEMDGHRGAGLFWCAGAGAPSLMR